MLIVAKIKDNCQLSGIKYKLLLSQAKPDLNAKTGSRPSEGTGHGRLIDCALVIHLDAQLLIHDVANIRTKLIVHVTTCYHILRLNFALNCFGVGYGEVQPEGDIILQHNCSALCLNG